MLCSYGLYERYTLRITDMRKPGAGVVKIGQEYNTARFFNNNLVARPAYYRELKVYDKPMANLKFTSQRAHIPFSTILPWDINLTTLASATVTC